MTGRCSEPFRVSSPIDDYGLDMHLSMGELTLNGSEQRPVMTSPGGPHSLKVTSDMGDVRVEFGG